MEVRGVYLGPCPCLAETQLALRPVDAATARAYPAFFKIIFHLLYFYLLRYVTHDGYTPIVARKCLNYAYKADNPAQK